MKGDGGGRYGTPQVPGFYLLGGYPIYPSLHPNESTEGGRLGAFGDLTMTEEPHGWGRAGHGGYLPGKATECPTDDASTVPC